MPYVSNGDLTIEAASSASASLSASSDYGLYIFHRDEAIPSTLTINDVDVTLIVTDSYYSGAISVENLVINNSNFIATNIYNSQALDISSLTVNGETIFPIPTSSSISINKDGEIGDKYSIWIGEIEITSENKDDVLGDGKVRYEPETNTLTLNGVTLTELGAANAAIYSQGKGLTLELEADSSIELAPTTE